MLRDKVVKPEEPFLNKLWILLVFVILVTALFWFANDQSALNRNKSERKLNGAKKNVDNDTATCLPN